MTRKRAFAASNPLSLAFWRSERGFVSLGGAILIGASLLASFIGARYGNPFVDGQTRADIKICITDVKAALAELRGEHAANPSADVKELGWDDARVQIFQRCQTLLARVANDLKNSGTSGFSGLGRELTNLIPSALDGFTVSNKCSLADIAPGTAGVDFPLKVQAHVPFSAASATTVLNMTGAVASTSGNFRPFKGFEWSGTFFIAGKDSASAAGQVSSVNLVASSPVLDRNGNPFKPNGDIPCPEGSTIQPGSGTCLISCSASTSFTWKAGDPPKAKLTAGPTKIKKGSTAPVLLFWEIENGSAASILPDSTVIGTNPTGKVSGFREIDPPPDVTTTWTLTVNGVGNHPPATATATVEVEAPAEDTTVTITSPAPDTKIAEEGVTVTGTVVPVPDEAHRKAQILVNGAFLAEATIDANGNFSGRTLLQNLIQLSDITVVGNPGIFVTKCGALAEPISVAADRVGGAKNLIRVIVPLASGSASHSVQVEHAITVNRFQVSWGGGCGPAPPQDDSVGLVVGANLAPLPIGSVRCGFRFGTPIHCTDVATITVGTSVGSKIVGQTWTASIESCD